MTLSPYKLRKAREVYTYFNVLNSVSWNLLVGVIITLFALRLGATPTYIGFLSSAFYISLFLLPLGKILAKRFSIIGVFSVTWILRSLCMLFAVAAPFFDYAGQRKTALALILLGVFLFHGFRGIGMIGNNPVLSNLAAGPDRGSFMTQIQIIGSSIGMAGSFVIAMILGMEPPVFIFSILLIIGVITGVLSGKAIRKVPEPPIEKDRQEMNLVSIFKDAFSQDSLKHFMFILFLVVMVSGVTRTFAVVYAREVFEHNDGLISLYSVFGGLGYLIAGLSIKFLVDRLGAKPLFLVCLILGLVSLIPVIFFPLSFIDNIAGTILFMVFLFFMLNFGFLGAEGIAQTYFLALIPQDKVLDLGILYFFVFGAAGAAGSFLSGLLLDLLMLLGVSPFFSFKVLFIILFALAIAALAMQNKMKSLGSLPLKDALDVIFSFKDLRAISLLDKLDKAEDSHEEEALLGALHDTSSHLAIDGILERARSPKFLTRVEAIRALEKLGKLSDKAIKALMEDVINNQYTTAYISARVLGNNRVKNAIPLLRELSVSNDYMLAGEAIIALSKMNDEEFRPEIEKIILESQNPRLKIMGAEALGYYHCPYSISILLDMLRGVDPPPYLREEVILSIASILGVQRFYYKLLVRYKENNSLLHTLIMDEAESAVEYFNTSLAGKKKSAKDKLEAIAGHADIFQDAVRVYIKENNGDMLSRWILEFPDESKKDDQHIINSIICETVVDAELNTHDSLRLLIVQWAARKLRTFIIRIK
ncbi:MAG: MFS transporter [Treponema sp.]|jgi:MFS family permease|nr:MFS transporter [Treponema sp.]